MLKDRYDITFTEEDRLAAEPFGDIYDCIIATACKRLGIPVRSVGGFYVEMTNGKDYNISNSDFYVDKTNSKHPYYDKSVVGEKITLTKGRF